MKSSHALWAAGILGLTGVALGAFGAHALQARLTELGTRDRWETAVQYHLIHTVAIFAAAAWLRLGLIDLGVALTSLGLVAALAPAVTVGALAMVGGFGSTALLLATAIVVGLSHRRAAA